MFISYSLTASASYSEALQHISFISRSAADVVLVGVLQIGGLLSFNIIFPSEQPSIARLIG